MGGDKASNKIDDLGGKAKEALGKVAGDKDTENKGKSTRRNPASRMPARRSRTRSRTRRQSAPTRPVILLGGGPNSALYPSALVRWRYVRSNWSATVDCGEVASNVC